MIAVRSVARPAIVLPLAIAAGALVVVSPLLTIGIAAASGLGLVVLTLDRRAYKVFFGLLAILLVGYLFLNKGMAYIGLYPLYISEVGVFLALLVILIALPRYRVTPLHALLFLFMGWGLVRTVPYVGRYGADALRDAVAWGYAIFAIALDATLEARHFDQITRWYRRIFPLFVIWLPFAAVAVYDFSSLIPRLPGPGGGTTIIFLSHGQIATHLAMGAAFVLVGLYAEKKVRFQLPEPFLWAIWLVGAALIAAVNRGAMLAMGSIGIALLLFRNKARWVSLGAMALLFLTLLALVDPVVPTGRGRPVSFTQLADNVVSVFTTTDEPGLEGTKEFRVAWWNKIIGYTFEGPYFWTGKGYGRNLGLEDGFSDGVLRAPHNSHLEFLARAGVPGLVLWLVLQATYALMLLRSALRARRIGARFWFQVQTCILVFWLAAMVNMTFDPYLQGPHGGIWFWSMFGIGLAAMRLSRQAVEAPATEQAASDPDAPESPDTPVRDPRPAPRPGITLGRRPWRSAPRPS